MRVDIITIFPEMVTPLFQTSMLKIAVEKGALEVKVHNLRDFTTDPHRKVDDKPFGGGPGMLFTPEPVFRAVEHAVSLHKTPPRLIMMTPQGRLLTQECAAELAREEGLVILAGHYEGFDERIRTGLGPDEISLGDFVLTGGEIPAMALVDAVARLRPGVLGCAESGKADSFARNRLGWPQYTRPRIFRGMAVPEVLLSGDHAKISQWREDMALQKTKERRADLLKGCDDANGR